MKSHQFHVTIALPESNAPRVNAEMQAAVLRILIKNRLRLLFNGDGFGKIIGQVTVTPEAR
jgi:hypothetical protein